MDITSHIKPTSVRPPEPGKADPAPSPVGETEPLKLARPSPIVPPVGKPDELQLHRSRPANPADQPDRQDDDPEDVSTPELPQGRYRYEMAFEPDLERALLKIVDEKSGQAVAIFPPEELARMLQEIRALLEGEDKAESLQPRRLNISA